MRDEKDSISAEGWQPVEQAAVETPISGPAFPQMHEKKLLMAQLGSATSAPANRRDLPREAVKLTLERPAALVR
jgi:hypothetical protein